MSKQTSDKSRFAWEKGQVRIIDESEVKLFKPAKNDLEDKVDNYNPNHDKKSGKFSDGNGSGASSLRESLNPLIEDAAKAKNADVYAVSLDKSKVPKGVTILYKGTGGEMDFGGSTGAEYLRKLRESQQDMPKNTISFSENPFKAREYGDIRAFAIETVDVMPIDKYTSILGEELGVDISSQGQAYRGLWRRADKYPNLIPNVAKTGVKGFKDTNGETILFNTDTLVDIFAEAHTKDKAENYNDNHDPKSGRFATGDGSDTISQDYPPKAERLIDPVDGNRYIDSEYMIEAADYLKEKEGDPYTHDIEENYANKTPKEQQQWVDEHIAQNKDSQYAEYISEYVGNKQYSAINTYLRSPEFYEKRPDEAAKMQELTKVLKMATQADTVKKDFSSWRAGMFNEEYVNGLKAGSLIDDKGIVSTSLDADYAADFGGRRVASNNSKIDVDEFDDPSESPNYMGTVLFRLNYKAGQKGLWAESRRKSEGVEHEFIPAYGSQFYITDSYKFEDESERFSGAVVDVDVYQGGLPKGYVQTPMFNDIIKAMNAALNTSDDTNEDRYVWKAEDITVYVPKELAKNYNPNHDKKGQFSTGSTAVTVVPASKSGVAHSTLRGMVKSAKANGGLTTSIAGNSPSEGIAYAPRKDTETIISSTDFDEKALDKFVDKHFDLLKQEGMHIGGWFNEEDKNWYLDISKVGEYNKSTIQEAQDAEQLAVFDLKTFEEIKTGDIIDGKYKRAGTAKAIFDKAFGQRVESRLQEETKSTSDEIDTTKNLSAAQAESVKRIEDSIRMSDVETFYAVDADGNEVTTANGDKGSVDVSEDVQNALRDTPNIVLTHNHPGNDAFSREDILLAAKTDALQVRAVGNKYLYIANRPENGWPQMRLIQRRYNTFEGSTLRSTKVKVRNGVMTEDEAASGFYHSVNNKLAKDLNYEYTRIAIDDV